MIDIWIRFILLHILLGCYNANALSIRRPEAAGYNPGGKTNVAVYWGQGPNQKPLSHYCEQPEIDIIIVAFMHVFPAQGNGYPGTNFGNQCWGPPYVYKGPGNDTSKDQLQAECPQMIADIPKCQKDYGKKILLSLGGSTNTYQLTGAANGRDFADFLWGAFGPLTSAWSAANKPRPFDTPGQTPVEVDGFDFDIQYESTDNSEGYVALIQRLRNVHFARALKPLLITGAPQCVVPDANMATMIARTRFDIIYVQFYNTPACSARSWVDANPSNSTFSVEQPSGFSSSYSAWTNFIAGTASNDAKLYIGLAGSETAGWDKSFFVGLADSKRLLKAYICKVNFGGVMMWEATHADNLNEGVTYFAGIKNALTSLISDVRYRC